MREQILGTAAFIFLSSASCAIAEDSVCKCWDLKDPNQQADCLKQCILVKRPPHEPRSGGTAYVPDSKDNWATTRPWQPWRGDPWTYYGLNPFGGPEPNKLVIERKPDPEWDWKRGQTPPSTGPNT